MSGRRRMTACFIAAVVLVYGSSRGGAEVPLPAEMVSAHTLQLGGREIAYSATAGSINLRNDKGERTAEIFYVAYILNGANAALRPITFAFNGGPGAGSAFLHLGALGPRVLDFGDGRAPPFGERKLVDNPDTWLDFTDLVFIDPVGTGYSRALISGDDAAKAFLGVRQDLDTLGVVIRLALASLDRFASPLFLVGESYGGFRAAKLPAILARDQGLQVAGAVMISPVLEFSLMHDDAFNPMSWALRLPSYAAVNLEAQGKLSDAALREAERFALGEYLSAFVAPPRDAERQARLYAAIAKLIGLPEEVVARWEGTVPLSIFIKEARHGENALVSRYDGSVAGMDPAPWAYTPQSGDPILEGLKAPITAAFVTYARDELKFKVDRSYDLLSSEVNRRWEWREGNRFGAPSPSASEDLKQALALNPRLRVLVAHGMTDLQTPYLASRYVIEHLPRAVTQDRAQVMLYAGGHMMYLRPESRAKLRADARVLYGE